MRWSLIVLLSILTVSLPVYPGVDGGRVVRDDSADMGLFQKLFNAIMGDNGDLKDSTSSTTVSSESTQTTSTANPSTTTEETTTTSTVGTGGTTSGITGSTTTTASDENQKNARTSTTALPATTEKTQSTTTAITPPSNPECDKPNDITTYCNVTEEMGYYLQWDTRVEALVGKVFSKAVIDQLLSMCQPGSWCLSDDYINAFSETMGSFFSSPMCGENVEDCVDDILYQRAGCPNMLRLSVLDDSLTLLCQMVGLDEITPECFGHTIATLHVTLADEIRAISKDIVYGEEFCLGPYVGMTRKFMCTLERCPSHEQLFREYGPWMWFMNDAPAIKDICQLESVCGDKELLEEEDSLSTTFSTTTTSTQVVEDVDENTNPEDEVNKASFGKEDTKKAKPVFIIQGSDESTRLLIGVITGAIMAVLGLMVLVCAVLKRMRRRNRYLTKDGYSKLQSEETD